MKRKGWFLFCIFICLLGSLGLFSACDPNDDNNNNDPATEAPAAPDNLGAVVCETEKAVDISWNDNSDNESGFVLERKLYTEGEGSFSQILGNLDPNTLSAVDDDSSLEYGEAYQYRVKAFNNIGDSEYSNWAYAYIPLEGGSSEQALSGFLYVVYAAIDEKLWYTPEDPANPSNTARYEVTDASGQQNGSAISADFDPGSGLLYVGFVDTTGKLWYTAEDPSNPSNSARYEVTDASGQQSGSAISVDFDPGSGLLYVGFVDTFGDLWYTAEDPSNPSNSARYEVTDASGQQSGSAISVDFDPDSGLLYVGFADTFGDLWYTAEDPSNPSNSARYEVTDASGQQSGSAISVDFDPDSGLLYVGFADTFGDLWYTAEDPSNPSNSARYEVTDASGQQSGSAISVDFDPGSGLLYVGFVDTTGKLWYTAEDPSNPSNSARYEVTDASGQQSGTAVGITF